MFDRLLSAAYDFFAAVGVVSTVAFLVGLLSKV